MNPEETVVRTTYPYSFATTNDAILDPSCLELNRGLDRMLTACLERFDWLKNWDNQTNQSNLSYYDVGCLPRYILTRFPQFYPPFDVFELLSSCRRWHSESKNLQQQTKSRMKCLVFLVAVGLFAMMVGYSSATTTVAVAPSSVVAGVSASQAAASVNVNATTPTPAPATTPATTAESLGVNVLPSAFIMSVAILVAALQ